MTSYLGEEKLNEKYVYHGTTRKALENICVTNFDVKKSGSSYGCTFGHGNKTLIFMEASELRWCATPGTKPKRSNILDIFASLDG